MTEAETGAILGTDSTWEELLTFRTEEVINTEYALTCYVNDINREYTEVLTEYTVSGSKTDSILGSIIGTEEIQVLTDYVYGNQRIYGTGETTAYYLYDGTGSVTEQVNQRADLLNTYRYDPYGTLTSGNVGESNYYGYRGEETNPITGMQYLRYRYYDIAAGRFQTPDSYLGSLIQPISQNRYGYTGNNPVMYGDKSGHMPYWVWKTLMGITIGSMVGWTIGTNVGFVSSSIESYNTQKATTGKVNGWKVLGDGIIGGYSSGFGGLVGGAIEGGLSVNTTNPIAQVAIGAGSNTADGIVSRYTEALMRNWFTKDPKINVMQYTFDEDAIAADVVIGGGSAVLGMGADKILGKVLKKVPVAAVAKWFIDQRNKICGTSNSVNSGNPIRKGLDINLQFFAMDTQTDEAVEAVAKNSDVTDAGTAGGHVTVQGGNNSWIRNLDNTSELNVDDFFALRDNGVVKVNLSGSDRPLTGAPNSYYKTGNGEHIFVYDGDGKLIYDISSNRVKGFRINVDPNGVEHYQAYKLEGAVPNEIKELFGW